MNQAMSSKILYIIKNLDFVNMACYSEDINMTWQDGNYCYINYHVMCFCFVGLRLYADSYFMIAFEQETLKLSQINL
jgi:hypothetical protein